jgi:O-antigen/teichoic acid export membrane protein
MVDVDDSTRTDLAHQPSVGRQVGKGAQWGLLSNALLRAGSLVSGIVLAHLLSPQDYGVYAIALVALTLLQSMNELGVSLAVVRWEGDVRIFAPTVMTIAITSSTVLYGLTYVLAPFYCEAMGSPSATSVVRLLCVSVILDGIAAVPVGILNRTFMQRSRLYCDALSFGASTGLTIWLAAIGVGAASFAWGRILGNVISICCYFALCPIKIRPGWNTHQARALIRFGLPLASASLLVLAVSNIDNIIVGAVAGDTALGLYLIAFNLSSWPLTVFSEAARRVSLAGFSRLAGNIPLFARSMRMGLALLVAASMPICVALSVYAEPILVGLYGSQWAPAAAALRFLAILGLLRVVLFVGYDALVALRRSRTLLVLQAIWLTCLIPALIFGTNVDGIRGTSIAHVFVAGAIVSPAFLLVFSRLGIAPGRLLRAWGRPVLGGIVMAVAGWGVLHVIHRPWPQLLVGAAVTVAVYVPIVHPMRYLMPGHRRYVPRHANGVPRHIRPIHNV